MDYRDTIQWIIFIIQPLEKYLKFNDESWMISKSVDAIN